MANPRHEGRLAPVIARIMSSIATLVIIALRFTSTLLLIPTTKGVWALRNNIDVLSALWASPSIGRSIVVSISRASRIVGLTFLTTTNPLISKA